MLALLTDGTIDQTATQGASWTPLAAPGAARSRRANDRG